MGSWTAGDPDRHRHRPGAGRQPPHSAQKQKGFSALDAASTNAQAPHAGQGQDHKATCTRTKASPLDAPGGQAGQRTTAQREEHTAYTATGTDTDQHSAPPRPEGSCAHRATQPRQSTGNWAAQVAAQMPAAAADRNDSTTTQPDTERAERRTTKAPAKTRPERSHQDETAATEGTIISLPERTNNHNINNAIVAQCATFVKNKVAQYATFQQNCSNKN